MPIIAPSLLSADFSNLKKDIDLVNNSEADWFHIDVMDGGFVPNISFGFPVLKDIQKYAEKPLDVHLMIVKPDQYFKKFRDLGADIITIHYEACKHLHRSIFAIKELGAKAGVSLNPHTPVSMLSEVIRDIDVVLVMSVNPGYGGQKFIDNTYDKLKELTALIEKKNASAQIEIDGGVTLENAKKLIDFGCDILVAGNTVFASKDPIETIRELKNI